MLLQLTVENFVLIDNVTIDFNDGLHVFTGETGAGKSLMVDAIALLSGARASTTLIKKDEDSAYVEGVFKFNEKSEAGQLAHELGYDVSDVLVFSRQITKDNRNVCKINHKIVPLKTLRDILSAEIDIHSQHDTQYLLQEKNHIRLLDNYLGDHQLFKDVQQAFKLYKDAQTHTKHVEALILDTNDLDFLQFQLNELETLSPSLEDYEQLHYQQKEMMAFEKISTTTNQVLDLFDQEGGVLEASYEAQRLLETIDNKKLKEVASMMFDGYTILSEARTSLVDYVTNLSFDQEQFDTIMGRLAQYDRLKRKHGGSVETLLAKQATIQETIYNVEHHQQVLEAAQLKEKQAYQAYHKVAQALSSARKKAAQQLSQAIETHLKDLQLPHAKLDVIFTEANPSRHGIDKVVFYLKTNPGSDFAPLAKIASGGELSRLMLGLKVIFAPLQGCGTIIFDEIDVGVSGSVAHKVGAKMHALSLTIQTFAITHLPVVASFGNNHFNVYKSSTDATTHVSIELLSKESRIEQLALLASGRINDASLKAAQALLKEVSEKNTNE